MSLRLDLHSHSFHSGDSRLSPREMVRLARARGLNGLAVTDHETVQGGLEARAANTDPDFLVIPGVEYATEHGHVVGLFLERELDGLPVRTTPADKMQRVAFDQVVQAIHAQGGIAVLAHPFQARLRLPEGPFSGPQRVDALEGFNARAAAVRNPLANEQAMAFAGERGIPAVGGSDAHLAAELGRGYCRVDGLDPGGAAGDGGSGAAGGGGPASAGDVRAAILAGRTTPQGRNSPRTVIPLSQVNRMLTSGRFGKAPRVVIRLLLTALGPPGLWLENRLRGPLREPSREPLGRPPKEPPPRGWRSDDSGRRGD